MLFLFLVFDRVDKLHLVICSNIRTIGKIIVRMQKFLFYLGSIIKNQAIINNKTKDKEAIDL